MATNSIKKKHIQLDSCSFFILLGLYNPLYDMTHRYLGEARRIIFDKLWHDSTEDHLVDLITLSVS